MRPGFSRLAILLAMTAAVVPSAPAADGCAMRSGSRVTPLVELYTSEGCSSCPPADRWLSRSFRSGDANFLAFHVDYWDAIGWPDRFASPRYSQRQRQRVGAVGGATVYTPQVMVGDQMRAPWRSDAEFRQALRDAGGIASVGLALRLRRQDGQFRAQLGAARSDAAAGAAKVWLAQYVDGQATNVRAGENRGATLHHDRVVRHLWGPWSLQDVPLARTQPLPATAGAWGLVAFVQDARGRILQSLDLPAPTCVDQARVQ